MKSAAPGMKTVTPAHGLIRPSRTYTHTYGVNFEYPNAFCPQRENLKYFKWVADHFDIRKDITFKTEVKSVVWDEAAKLWEIKAEGPDGPARLAC